MLQEIVKVKRSKYFSIIVDSTPDISHIDELSFIIRYIQKDGVPVERFMGFLPNVGHKSEQLEEAIISFLKLHDLDIKNCVGQSYDNASNMSGCYSGLLARILKLNPLATYVPCSAHSLNLVGICAAECVPQAVNFFNALQCVFTFFAASTYRWNLLMGNLTIGQKVVERADGTRWSSCFFATDSSTKSWKEIQKSLLNIADCPSEKSEVRCEAKGLMKHLDRFEFAFMSVFWNTVLGDFTQQASNYSQKGQI